MTVDVRHLRAFLAIADEQNLTRAAQDLHISQPALSRTLAQLEAQLGVHLVDRSTHHLRLTEAGLRFERLAAKAVRSFDDAIASAAEGSAPLRVGQTWSVAAHLAPIVKAWTTTHPDRPLRVLQGEDRTAGLLAGRADLAFTRGPLPGDGFRSVVLEEEARLAVLPSDHPMAGRRVLRLRDLSDQTLVVHTLAGTTTPALWPTSRRPARVVEVTSMDDWLVTIASGAGIGVTVQSTATLHPHPDVRFVPLSDAPPVPLLIAWPRKGEHPWVKEFVRIARGAGVPARR